MRATKVRVHCDQCQMLSINGIPCHESGCPNSRKIWDPESQSWKRLVECSNCGFEYFAEDSHDCSDLCGGE